MKAIKKLLLLSMIKGNLISIAFLVATIGLSFAGSSWDILAAIAALVYAVLYYFMSGINVQ